MLKKLSYLVAVILTIVLVYFIYDLVSFKQARNAFVQNKGLETTAALRDQVDGILSKIAKEGERLAELFGANEYSISEIEQMIKESSLSIPEIQGVTACYEPDAFSDERRLFCPYYNKGSQDYMYVGETYDYSDANASGTAWYTGVRDNGAKWVEPYFAKAAQDWYVDYGIPFYYSSGPKKGQVRGTITMSFIASGFKNMIHNLSLGKTGYGVITSNKGTFLAHPINEYVGTTKLDSVKQNVHPELAKAFEAIKQGETGQVQYRDANQKDETLFYFDKIPTTGWGIGLLFYKGDMLEDGLTLNRKYIRLAIWASLLFLCVLGIYFNKDYLDEGEIWTLSILSSILLLMNILFVGYLQHTDNHAQKGEKSQPITDLTSLSKFITARHLHAEELKGPKMRPVPTGIYVSRMEFEDSYNLNIGGKLWQKYPLELAEEVTIGFDFPQMSIEITPLNNNDHLIFTPDLASYNYTNPSKKSGLNPSIAISGSEVLESYFNYSIESYDTDFGYGAKGLFEEVPVLHYNVHTRRLLLNAFVTYLIPIFVTLVMVFILIYACHKSQERQGIIESMAAFFFVLIFSHIDLRKEIVTADLIYMEYFYFIAYFLLVVATGNLITYTKDKSKIFDFNNNQLFKASFFPVFLLMVLLVTLLKFY